MPLTSITFPHTYLFTLLFIHFCTFPHSGWAQEYSYNAVFDNFNTVNKLDKSQITLSMIHQDQLNREFTINPMDPIVKVPFADFSIYPSHPNYFFRLHQTTIEGAIRLESFNAIPKPLILRNSPEIQHTVRKEAQKFLHAYLETDYLNQMFHVKHLDSQNSKIPISEPASDEAILYEIIPLFDNTTFENTNSLKLTDQISTQTLTITLLSPSGINELGEQNIALEYSEEFTHHSILPNSFNDQGKYTFITPKSGHARYNLVTQQGMLSSPVFPLQSKNKPTSLVIRHPSEIIQGQLYDDSLYAMPNRRVKLRLASGKKLISSTDQFGHFQFWPLNETIEALEIESHSLNGDSETRIALPRDIGEEYFMIFEYLIPTEGTP